MKLARVNYTRRERRLQAELGVLNSKINDLYWTFTRCRRSHPPVMVAPELYSRRSVIIRELHTLAIARRLRCSRA